MTNSNIKFEGYKKHEPLKINPFVDKGEEVYTGENQSGYLDERIVTNDNLKTKNVHRDLKKLEEQFNVLCSTAEEENKQGNGDNGEKHNYHMNSKYMKYQTQECKETFYNLAQEN